MELGLLEQLVQPKKNFLQNYVTNKKLQTEIIQIFKQQPTYFPEFSLTLLLFTHQLYQKCINKKVKTLYFLSREGKLLKQLFDLYQDHLSCSNIKTHYLLASRQSTVSASLKPLEQENFSNLFSRHQETSIKNFCLTYGFDCEIIKKITQSLNINFTKIECLENSPDFKKLITHQTFQIYYEQHRNKMQKNILEYLNTLEINQNQSEIYLVDVGWRGMIQDNLYDILSQKIKITGFYLGLHQGGAITEYNQKEGLLFDFRKKWEKFYTVYKGNRALYETLLTADHDSPIGYAKGKSILGHAPEERIVHDEKIKPVQNIYIEYFKEILLKFQNYSLTIHQLENFFCKQHLRISLKPNKEEITWFNQLYRFENYGVFDYCQTKFRKKSRFNYYFHRTTRLIKSSLLLN